MNRPWIRVALLSLVFALVLAPTASADWPRQWGYTGWVADEGGDTPERLLVEGSTPTMRFHFVGPDIAYRVCWSRADGSRRHCRRRRSHGLGDALVVPTQLSLGPQVVRWYVDGKQVARWSWYFAPEDLE